MAAKPAALMHSLVLNHPFVDGNERIGVVLASDEELEALTLSVARGEVEALAIWLRQRLRPE